MRRRKLIDAIEALRSVKQRSGRERDQRLRRIAKREDGELVRLKGQRAKAVLSLKQKASGLLEQESRIRDAALLTAEIEFKIELMAIDVKLPSAPTVVSSVPPPVSPVSSAPPPSTPPPSTPSAPSAAPTSSAPPTSPAARATLPLSRTMSPERKPIVQRPAEYRDHEWFSWALLIAVALAHVGACEQQVL